LAAVKSHKDYATQVKLEIWIHWNPYIMIIYKIPKNAVVTGTCNIKRLLRYIIRSPFPNFWLCIGQYGIKIWIIMQVQQYFIFEVSIIGMKQ
jgi:hypothetical protein